MTEARAGEADLSTHRSADRSWFLTNAAGDQLVASGVGVEQAGEVALLLLGHRGIVGASRKAFLGGLLDGRPPAGRDAATAALTLWSALHGVWAVRTHEVQTQADAIAVASRLTRPDPVR